MYQLCDLENGVIKIDDNSFIPNNVENKDWLEYQRWISRGNTPLPANAPSIDERRKNILSLLLNKRDSEIYKNVTVNGNLFFADEKSQNLLNQALSSHERGIEGIFPANWILADGSVLVASYSDLKAVNAAMANRISACYANYYSLNVQIIQSNSPESIDISQGWE